MAIPPPGAEGGGSEVDDSGEADDGLVEVGCYFSSGLAREHGLVILALGGEYSIERVEPGEGGAAVCWRLRGVLGDGRKMWSELSAYEAERVQEERARRSREERGPERFYVGGGWIFVLWMTVLMAVFLWQQEDPGVTARGAVSGWSLFHDGQWWRAFTALFLHADLGHLVGNLLSGLFFVMLLSRLVGPWRAWAAMMLAGAAGNVVAAAIRFPEEVSAIGASTAVFAALGALSGCGLRYAWLGLPGRGIALLRMAGPLVAGLVLLGWLGGGRPSGFGEEGMRTDVLGHGMGFACGVVAGWFLGKRR